MKISIQKIDTFGQGIDAYRIVPEKSEDVHADRAESKRPVEITANATRLGQQLRKQLLNERQPLQG